MTDSAMPNAARKQLRQFIEQLERLEEDKRGIAEDIRDKLQEAKAVGFDVKIIRQLLKLRKKSKTDRDEEEAVLATYMHALGMLGELAETPLGQAALQGEFGDDADALKEQAAGADDVSGKPISSGRPTIAGDGSLDKVRDAYRAAVKRKSTLMLMPDGYTVHPVESVRAVLLQYDAISQAEAERDRTKESKRKAEDQTTISINGGPEVPMSTAMDALRIVREREARQ